ncbi:MAG: hypothetical protein A2W23_09985 [Planctomycetes bacterium RBG_16_43_13]|nr:MAG: hypothetical protein A2W23_09985 [Planctomycetes bacterium RBG_16_43_13]
MAIIYRPNRIRRFISPAMDKAQALQSAIGKNFAVVDADSDLYNYWSASAKVLSSDAYIIERSSVVHYVGNPVQNKHPLRTKYTPQTLYNKCNTQAWYTDWQDEVPFNIAPWPIPDIPTPPDLWLFYDNASGVATLRMQTTSATTAILVRAIPWVWFSGRGPWEGKERDKLRKIFPTYGNSSLGRICSAIHGYCVYPEGWHEIVEHKFDSIRGGAAYGGEVMKLKDLGPGVLHSTVGLIRRWKPFDVSGPEWPKFFKKYPPGTHAPLPYNWFSSPAYAIINKDPDKIAKETKEVLDKLRRGEIK